MPVVYVVPGKGVAGTTVSYAPAEWPRDPTTNVPISPFGQISAFPEPVVIPYTFTDGQAVTINDQAEADRLCAAGFVSATPTVTPVPPGPASKTQGVVTSYIARGTVHVCVPPLPTGGPSTVYRPGQQVTLSQSDTDRLTATGMLSPTWPPT
jgi:hypothetical protein